MDQDSVQARIATLEAENARLLRALQAAEVVGTWDWDLATGRITANARFAEVFGLDPAAAAAGLPLATFLAAIHPADRDRVAAAIRQAVEAGAEYAEEFRLDLPGRPETWVLASGRRDCDARGRPLRFPGIVLDITARKRAEAERQASEATLGAVLDALPVGVILADAKGRILRDNAANRELWGISPETTGWEGYADWIGFWPATGARIQAHEWALARALLRGEVVRGELVECARFGTGERRLYLNNAAPIRNPAGEIIAAVAAEQDVTELHRAAAALRRSEARFRALAELTPNLVWFVTPAGRGEYLNGRWYAYTGMTPEQALPDGWIGAVHPEDRPRIATAWAAATARAEPYEAEVRLRRHDGEYRWHLDRAVPVRAGWEKGRADGEIVVWFGSSTDIHARKLAEASLAESEARLRLAQEAAQLGVYERDLVEGRARWSPTMFRLWGIDPAGRSPCLTDEEYLGLVLPEDREHHRARRDAMRDDPAVLRFAYEFRIRRHDTGEIRWIASRGEYVRDAAGRAVMVRGTNHDVTERKAAEERQALLMREVDHRARNALAVVQAALRLTPQEDAAAYAKAVEGRVTALARAHTLLAEDRWAGADLRALLAGELQPFLAAQRAEFDGPPVVLPAFAAQPLAIAVHELATNAVKHGALSAPGGCLSVRWALEEGAPPNLRLRWVEAGGPRITAPPARRGFGSRVLDGTLRRQLGGTVVLDWPTSGLACEIAVPLRPVAGLAAE